MGVSKAARARRVRGVLAAGAALCVLAGQGAGAALAAPAPATPAVKAGWMPPPAAGSKAAAALAARHHLGAAAKFATVPGHHAGRVRVPDLIRPGQRGRKGRPPAWPAAGTATVTLPAAVRSGGRARRAKSTRWVRAGGLPVQVAVASGSPVRAVRVGVASHRQAVAAGSDGMLLELTRADGAVLAGRVRVRVNYSRFAAEYGGGYGARLALFAMPDCALTTPSRRTCRGMAPVPFANDSKSETIAATLRAAPGWEPDGRAGPLVYAIASTTSGGAGDYKATSLSPSSLWQAGLQTGDFTWSYPLRVPPAIGGKAPSLSLSYDSGGTDGETAQSNAQPGQLGEGFSLAGAGGFIERKYTSCGDLIKAGNTNTGQPSYEQTGDQCWDGLNAYISSAGHSGQLIYDPSNSSWHLSSDDGSTVEFLSGADNGAYDGSYWEIIAPDGTRYYYGLNELPGYGSGDPVTNSVWTMPVFGIRSGDPCNDPGSYTGSVCANMPWRWNLDLVVDPNGNATTYFYNPETNYYATDSYAYVSSYGTVTSNYGTAMQYDTGGTLTDIYYGMQDRGGQPDVYAGQAFHVSMWYAGRCSLYTPANYTSSATISQCDNSENRATWPDTPWDLHCASASGCTGSQHDAPAFFDTQMLYKVKTELFQGANSPETVDTWTLGYNWLAGDVNWDLTLGSVQYEGWVGGSGTSLPPAEFGWTGMDNRVDYGESFPLMYRYRLTSILSETGSQTNVAYNPGACNSSELSGDAAVSGNTMPCFPQKWTSGDFGGNPTNLWYYKYTVAAVTVTDPTGGGQVMPTTYTYCNTFHCGSPGTGANWHYDTDNDLVPAKDKSWDQWRGYNYVRVVTGTGANQSETDYTYLTGMDGDPVPCSSCNSGWSTSSVQIQPQESLNALQAGPGNNADPVADSNALNGFLLEKIVWNGPHSTEWAGTGTVSDTVNWPWVSPPTATSAVQPWGEPDYAEIIDTAETDVYTPLSPLNATAEGVSGYGGNPPLRQIKTAYTYSSGGLLQQVSSMGDTAVPGQATCTSYSYFSSTINGLIDYPQEVTTTEGYCSQRSGAVTISDTKYSYDGQSFGSAPANGNVTETDVLAPSSADQSGDHWVAQSRESYDSYGRVVQDENSGGYTTFYTYSSEWSPGTNSAQEYATTQVKVQAPLTSSLQATTVTGIYAEWGSPYDVVDPSGLRTDYAYDALGDVTGVWLPGQTGPARSGDGTPNYAYAYNISQSAPSTIETTTLTGPNEIPVTGYQLYDSLLRLRQSQVPAEGQAGGTEVTDTEYDSQGRVLLTNSAYTVAAAPSPVLFVAAQAAVPSSTVLTYDGAGRETESALYSDGTQKWGTQFQYPYGDETTEIPPSGGVTTTTYADGFGRPVQIEQSQPGGGYNGTSYTYSYDSTGGTITTIKDAGGENWSFTDNRLGEQTYGSYPDAGTAVQGWNDLGELTTVTDAAGNEISYAYDAAGRKKAEYNTTGGAGETLSDELAAWSYDTAPLAGGNGQAIGQLAEADSYIGGAGGSSPDDYRETIGGYDDSYRPASESWTIPSDSVTGALGGQTFTFNYTYNVDGSPDTASFPAAGQMSSETVHYGYDNLGSPYSLWSGGSDYVQRAGYTPTGLPSEIDFGAGPSAPWSRLLDLYDTATQRLSQARVQQENGPGNWNLVSDTSYAYDPYGNITSAGESVSGDYQCYQYDYLDRLTAAWSQGTSGCAASPPGGKGIGGPAPYQQTLAYDTGGTTNGSTAGTTGRIKTDDLITGPSSSQTTTDTAYSYSPYTCTPPATCGQPHAPESASVTGSQSSAMTYSWNGPGDLTGYTTSPGAGSASYDWDGPGAVPGQLYSATTTTSSGPVTTYYRYDAAGNLLIQRDGPVTTVYLPGEDLTADGTTVTATRYYTFAGQVTAIAVPNPAGGPKLVSWIFPDPRGTATTAINAATAAVTRRYYTPYGNPLNTPPSWPGTRGYTGGTTDPATHLTNLGAREYNPALPQFLSPDPILTPGNPNDLDPYTYAYNNPVNRTDPAGQRPTGPNNCGNDPSCTAGSQGRDISFQSGTWGDFFAGFASAGLDLASLAVRLSASGDWAVAVQPNYFDYLNTRLTSHYNTKSDAWGLGRAAFNLALVFLPAGETLDGADTALQYTGDAIRSIAPEAVPAGDAGALPGVVGPARVPFGPGVQKAWTVLDRVLAKGSPLPGYKGGSVFQNSDGLLPGVDGAGNAITYREWDVNPYVKGVNRGPERLVTSSDGSAYYTGDHYDSFLQIWGPG